MKWRYIILALSHQYSQTPFGKNDYAILKLDCMCFSSVVPDEIIQLTAVTWLKEFVQLAGRLMLPFTSGILAAVLPCLAYDDDLRRSILDAAKMEDDVNGWQ